jgi:polysaccharide export outer membrane protein
MRFFLLRIGATGLRLSGIVGPAMGAPSLRTPPRTRGALSAFGRAARFLAFVGAVAACKPPAPTYDYSKEPDPRGQEFQVGPLDQLRIDVWKNRDMSADVTVRPDGMVTLPLIGDVKAAGRTPTELQKDIAKRLSDYLREGELAVSVGITAVNSYHFTVMGSVEHAGYYTSRTYVTAVEAVAIAGGPNRFAGNEVVILRGQPTRRIPIDLRRAVSVEHANENLVVLRGDVLVVP